VSDIIEFSSLLNSFTNFSTNFLGNSSVVNPRFSARSFFFLLLWTRYARTPAPEMVAKMQIPQPTGFQMFAAQNSAIVIMRAVEPAAEVAEQNVM
jgi:hypothetical protein